MLILAAAWIAPSERKVVPAVVVAVLMFMVAGVSIFIRIANRDWMKLLNDLSIVVGSSVSLVQQIRKNGPKRGSSAADKAASRRYFWCWSQSDPVSNK